MEEENNLKVSIAIPFPTRRAAEIAYNVLRIDPEPKRNHVKKSFSIEGTESSNYVLKVDFLSDIAKNLRVGITNFFETLILCTETQEEFGPPVSENFEQF